MPKKKKKHVPTLCTAHKAIKNYVIIRYYHYHADAKNKIISGSLSTVVCGIYLYQQLENRQHALNTN